MERRYILLVLCMVSYVADAVIHGNSVHDKFERISAKINQGSLPPYNATIDCGDPTKLYNTCHQCTLGLFELFVYGYPWLGRNALRNKSYVSVTDGRLKDVLDSMNDVCDAADRAHVCLRDSGVQNYCLMALKDDSSMKSVQTSQFVCHHQPRNESLLHSLQCLYDNRLLTMLYFHIVSQCGIDILDRIMTGNRNVLWYEINVWPPSHAPAFSELLCLPKDIVSTCVRTIVESRCGNMTAVLVQDYILYLQHWIAQALESAGLDPDFCHHDVHATPIATYISPQHDRTPEIQPASSPYTQLVRFVETMTPGSALDSVYGKYMVDLLKDSHDKYCNDTKSQLEGIVICMLCGEDTAGMARFNILQFSHQLMQIVLYHGYSCSRLTQFKACWDLLQQMCGYRVRFFALYATLRVDCCKIQTLMDDIGCPWQDMLIRHYLEASRKTVWPLLFQASGNPLFLESQVYTNSVRMDLEAVITFLQSGVEEIASRCGREPATQLGRLLHKIRYLQNDSLKVLLFGNN